MTVRDIYNALDKMCPFNTACDFDNVGMLVGNTQMTVKKAAVMLDCTKSGIEKAKQMGANLIITHHPVIFEPLKSINQNSVVFELIKSGIALISAHTNLDISLGGVSDCLCNALGFEDFDILHCADGYEGRLCRFDTPKTSKEVAALAGKALGTKVKYTGDNKIKTLAVFSGSAGGYLYESVQNGADGFLCGDIKHNVFVDAHNMGVSVFDAGHYTTEAVVIKPLCSALAKQFTDIEFVPVLEDYIKFE